MKRPNNFSLMAGILVVAVIAALVAWLCRRSPAREMTPAELKGLIAEQQITKATLTPTPYPGIYAIEGTAEAQGKTQNFKLTTHLAEDQIQKLTGIAGVKIQAPGDPAKGPWVNLAGLLIAFGVVGFLVYYQMSLTRSKSTAQMVSTRPSIRFTDVAGIEEAKTEVQEVVDFLKYPTKYKRLGGTLPKGVLLIGPPGTGKTMLAKAIACEAEANFFSAHGSDFNEVYVGVGAKRVRQLFRQALKNRPAIIFIDEIDCLGKNRKFDTHGELQQTNNALLAAMDGFESSEGIVVLAATNRPEDLDEALLRPGRFDRKVYVPYPDMKGRRAILKAHARNKPILEPERALDVIAQTTPGMSGADLANLINEAAILCAQNNAAEITLAELEASRDKVRFGKERKSMVLKQAERELVAFHEAGHATINLQMNLLPPLYKVSIIPRGNALGATTLLPQEDQHIHSKDFLLEELVVLMGGRAAEKLFFGTTTNGAAGDLEMARRIARRMVLEWGMGRKLYYEPEEADAEIEINRLLEQADREAEALIETYKKRTRCLAEALQARETLTREEVLALFRNPSPPEAGPNSGMNAFPV